MRERESSGSGFFDGFAWAVPRAFAGPLASCRFEQGDVLYPTTAAYRDAGGAVRGRAIQVLAPSRTARMARQDGEGGNRRSAHWATEVDLEIVDLEEGSVSSLRTTQGRLWTLLWKGPCSDFEAALRMEAPEPPLPRDARDLQGELETCLPTLDASLGRRGARRKGGSRFLLVVDLTNDASRAKASLVADQLARSGSCVVTDWTPQAAGIADAGSYSPTLVIREFRLDGRSVETIEAELRTCLYRGGRGGGSNVAEASARDGGSPDSDERPENASGEAADEEMEASSGRFSVSRHGLLQALP